jgi:hypothetical protein
MSQRFFLWAFTLVMAFAACKSKNETSVEQPGNANGAVNPETTDTTSGRAKLLPNAWKTNTCDLFTDTEFAQVFSADIKRDFANMKSREGYCLRTWKKLDWREREAAEMRNPNIAMNAENTLVVETISYATEVLCKQAFADFQKNAVGGYSEAVPGVGEMALWSNSGSAILARKGHMAVKVQVNIEDNAHDNLPKAKEVALVALQKMEVPSSAQ